MARVTRTARRGPLVAIAVLTWLGCSSTTSTELIVLVRLDPSLTLPVGTVTIDVGEPSGERVTSSVDLADLFGEEPTLGLRYRGGALSPVTVEARGDVGSMVVVDRAVTSFVSGERRLLVLVLRAACVGIACADETTTCGASATCVSASRPGESLPPFASDEQLDAGIPRDAPIVPHDAPELTDGGPPGARCLFPWNCPSLDDRCEDTATAGSCVGRGSSNVGEACAVDADCESGACLGAGTFFVCSIACNQNSDCGADGTTVCVADESTGYDGACVPAALSPCPGCNATSRACVAMRGGLDAVCTMGAFCEFSFVCDAGANCTGVVGSAGGQAACTPGASCADDELALMTGGVVRCAANTAACDVADPSCGSDHPECLPGAALGLSSDRAGELGVCVRSL